MGNRVVLAFTEADKIESFGVYLHWQGGIESIAAFLDYQHEVHDREGDAGYAAARLVQHIGNFIGGSLSLGLVSIDPANPGAADPGDNGVLLIDCNGKLKGSDRLIAHYSEDYKTKKIKKSTKATVQKWVAKAKAEHPYWQPEGGKPTLLGMIRAANVGIEHATEVM